MADDHPHDDHDRDLDLDEIERRARALVRRAVAVAEPPRVPIESVVAVAARRRSTRRSIVVSLAVAATLLLTVIVRGITDDRAPVTTRDVAAATGNGWASDRYPSLGAFRIEGAGMDGVHVPDVDIDSLVEALQPARIPDPAVNIVEVPRLELTPAADWPDLGRLEPSGTAGGYASVLGFATDDLAHPTRLITVSSGPAAVSDIIGDGNGHDTVAARDGTRWTLRSVSIFDDAVAAFSQPVDGYVGGYVVVFAGVGEAEVTAALRSTGSARDINVVELAGGQMDLPADLAATWHTTAHRTSGSADYLVNGGTAGNLAVRVWLNAGPFVLDGRIGGMPMMSLSPPSSSVLKDSVCRDEGRALVCGWTDSGTGAATPSLFLGTSGAVAFLTVWQDGVRIDVAAQRGTTATASGPAGLQRLFDRMGEAVQHLAPA